MAGSTSIRAATSRLARPTKELVVLFDDHGIVRRWSLQQFDDREIRPGSR